MSDRFENAIAEMIVQFQYNKLHINSIQNLYLLIKKKKTICLALSQ